MKSLFMILIHFSLLVGCDRVTPRVESDEIWPLAAKSHVIVTGTLEVPVASIQSCLSSNEHEYVELLVRRDRILKGAVPETIRIRWFTRPRTYAPHPERVIAFDGKKALLFLVRIENPSGLYFAGVTPRALSEPDAGLIRKVRREVIAQRNILAGFDSTFPPGEEPYYQEVKGLIDATTRKETQADAFQRLEGLGLEGVPAIILLMDDRRKLADPSISLQNPAGHWEAVRHYSPNLVVDAMDALLNQITGQSFGNVCNGGSERERREAVNGWRIYLYYMKNPATR